MLNETLVAYIPTYSYDALWQTLYPLMLFVLGIVVYSVFIFKFYRFVAKVDLIQTDMRKFSPGFLGSMMRLEHAILYIIKYFILFPLYLFFWFFVLSVLLIFLSKSNDIQQILLISVGLIGAIRITAYYNEDLSKDLAKMIPFALLGVFLVDQSFVSFADSFALVTQLPVVWRTLVLYMAAIVAIEFFLRILRNIFHNDYQVSYEEFSEQEQ